jgi:predicted protein tyrosine phosphatase
MAERGGEDQAQTSEGSRMSKIRRYSALHPMHGNYWRVLCVCAGGIARSPTAALVLSQAPYNFNTRSAGVELLDALIRVDETLVSWADQIVCMEQYQKMKLERLFPKIVPDILVLGIQDRFYYRDPELMALIRKRYDRLSGDNDRAAA